MENIILKFEAGKIYSCTSVCNLNCRWFFRVEKRTEKTILVTELNRDLTVHTHHQNDSGRKRIHVYDGVESVRPSGRYSMAPILCASDELTQSEIENADPIVKALRDKVKKEYASLSGKIEEVEK